MRIQNILILNHQGRHPDIKTTGCFFWYTHHANAEHDKSSILFLSNYKEHLILMNIFKLLLNLVLQTISKQYNCSFQWQKSIL